MYIGGDNVEKLYIGDTEVEKVYLGTDVVYEKASADLWNISSDGLIATRTSLPMTIVGSDYYGQPRTTVTNNATIDVTNAVASSGRIGNATITIDSNSYTNTGYRDCCIKLMSYTDNNNVVRNYMNTGEEPADCNGKYLILGKDGSIVGQSLTYIEKEADVPNNAFSYDSETDTITLGAGVWDASVSQNNPITLASDVVLNSMGGMYADDNWNYMMDIRKPSRTIYLTSGNPSTVPYIKKAEIRSNNTAFIGPAWNNKTTSINSSSYIDVTDWQSISGPYYSASSSETDFYFRNTSHIVEYKITIDTDVLNNLITSDYSFDTVRVPILKPSSTLYGATTFEIHYKDGTTNVLANDVQPSSYGQYYNVSVTNNDLLNIDYIYLKYRGVSTNSFSASNFLLSTTSNAEYNNNFSRSITCRTMDMGGRSRIEFSHGYKTPYYINYNNTTGLESISTTPTYPVVDPYS